MSVIEEETKIWRGEEEGKLGEGASDGKSWGEREVGEVTLSDKRLERRLKRRAQAFSQPPQAPINQARAAWAATQAAARFFANPPAAAKKIFAAPRLRTVPRREGQAVGLAIPATPSLTSRHHPPTTGLGPIGESRSDAHGLMMHGPRVVPPAGRP